MCLVLAKLRAKVYDPVFFAPSCTRSECRCNKRSWYSRRVYLIAVRRRLYRVDTNDLLEPVDLDQDEGVLEDCGGWHAAEEQVWSARGRSRTTVVRKTPVVVHFTVDRHLRLAARLHVVPEHASSATHTVQSTTRLTHFSSQCLQNSYTNSEIRRQAG